MKHAKETHNVRKFFIILLIFLIIYGAYRLINLPKKNNNDTEEKNNNDIITIDENKNENAQIEIDNEKTVENEKLVLESNYEKNRVQKIIFNFSNNELKEKNIYEKYEIPEDYFKQKEKINDVSIFETIKLNDETLEIYYKDLNSKEDYNKSYEEIYNKYMGIIGAYNVIE